MEINFAKLNVSRKILDINPLFALYCICSIYGSLYFFIGSRKKKSRRCFIPSIPGHRFFSVLIVSIFLFDFCIMTQLHPILCTMYFTQRGVSERNIFYSLLARVIHIFVIEPIVFQWTLHD